MQGQENLNLCWFCCCEDMKTSFFMFQWQTNGSMSMARSSSIAAAWILRSERGGAIAGPLGAQEPASTIERHTCRRREGGSQKLSIQAGEEREPLWGSLHLWLEPRAPGGLKRTVLQWTWIAQGWEVGEKRSGAVGNQPQEAKCSPAPTGQFLQMERGLCRRTLCWF